MCKEVKGCIRKECCSLDKAATPAQKRPTKAMISQHSKCHRLGEQKYDGKRMVERDVNFLEV